MKLKDLRTWADGELKKNIENPQYFLTSGVQERQISKVRAFLKGIVDRCNFVIINMEKNDTYTSDIDKYLRLIGEYGLPLPSDEKPRDQKNVKVDEKSSKTS